jgi:hypothetical protein
MCLSFEEKIRAKNVVTELDAIGKKIMELSETQGDGERSSHSFYQEQLINQHSSLIKELRVFIEKC